MSNRRPESGKAGWYPDPGGRDARRYFDGELWTDQYYQPSATSYEAAGPEVPATLSPLAYWKSAMTTGYGDFDGRARRREFWWTLLINLVVLVASGELLTRVEALDEISAVGYLIVGFGLLIPQLAVSVRRLHDIGKGGGWIFIWLVPFGGAILFYFLCQNTSPYDNDWGYPAK